MTLLARAIEDAREIVAVTALATVVSSQVNGSTLQEGDVTSAVADFHQQLVADGQGSWLTGAMYSPRVLRWLAGRVAKAAGGTVNADPAQTEETER